MNHFNFSIFFGDAQCSCDPTQYRSHSSEALLQISPFLLLSEKIYNNEFHFLKQVHSTSGLFIDADQNDLISFHHEGDYLITERTGLALGIVTADCLPLVIYDPLHKIIALAHAGWRGSVAGIAIIALQEMVNRYATDPATVQIFFGPSALACCYEVDEPFLALLRDSHHFSQVAQQRNGRYFFDLPLYNELLLQKSGILQKNINRSFNECTICNENYCSYRRTKSPLRNITAVVLH